VLFSLRPGRGAGGDSGKISKKIHFFRDRGLKNREKALYWAIARMGMFRIRPDRLGLDGMSGMIVGPVKNRSTQQLRTNSTHWRLDAVTLSP